jgi:4-amino-4-deoxy-L-arabinose transferase-like glycosyltransferase
LIASRLFWGALLASGLAVRCRQYLFAHSYWYDEAFLILPIRERGFAELLGPQPYNLVIPPVFLWVTHAVYEVGGDGELLMRLPAFLAGIAALFLMVPLARKVVGDAHAVWAFAFLVVCQHAVSHGCEVRPYTVDLLVMEGVLYCAAILLEPSTAPKMRKWAAAGLGAAATLGPWLSFTSAFALGGASLALAIHLRRQASRRAWLAWSIFNGVAGLSAALLWWLSARYMYYEGMIEHWGHRGWGGFPDWSSPLAIGKWLLGRPVEIGNYGNRELGVVLTLLAFVGAFSVARRSHALVVLLVAPFVLAVAAALMGKFPLAHRTSFFLLPCLWLLAASGISGLVAWGRQRGWELAFAGLLLVAGDFTWLVVRLAKPDRNLDYRGAYQFVHAHREPADLLWSQMAVVYQTYYGQGAPVLTDHDFEEAVQRAKSQRLWVVLGDTRQDLRQRFEAGGGRVTFRHHVSGLDVLLVEPADESAGGRSTHGP